MDPLSLTANIIAVLQATNAIISYINDVRNATAEQKSLAIEASNLYGLLISLRFRVDETNATDPWFTQVKLFGVENGPLDQYQDVLQKLVHKISASGKRGQIKSALMWTLTKSDVDNALRRLERLKSLVSIALAEDTFTLSKAIHEDLKDLREQNERLQSRVDRDLQTRLSQWLKTPDPGMNYHAALEKRHPETGLWLLKGQEFSDWQSSTSSSMWIQGDAGCGKTILSAAVLEEILRSRDHETDLAIAYFYFDFSDVGKQSFKTALRSLLLQLIEDSPARLQDLEQLYRDAGNGSREPYDDNLQTLLEKVVSQNQSKYIVLDALDECSDREPLLAFISSLITSSHPGLRILVTSRRERDIEESLKALTDYSINIQTSIVDQDIRTYVMDRVEKDTKLRKWPDEVRKEIVSILMDKAGGMFRWVYCQLESIRRCVKLGQLRRALSELPKTLDATYERIIQDLDSAGQLQDAVKALQWLCFSKRPLVLLELVEVLAIESGDNGGFFPEERLPDPADILVICSSFISYVVKSNDLDEQQKDASSFGADRNIEVRLAHFSVKEYLLSDRCPVQTAFRQNDCSLLISEGCLRYLIHLSEQEPLNQETVDQYALANYAAKYWWRSMQGIDIVQESAAFALSLQLLTTDERLLTWLKLFNVDIPWTGCNLSLTEQEIPGALYYAIRIGIASIVGKLVADGADVNVTGGYFSNPLQAASRGGDTTIVRMLLDAGANVHARTDKRDLVFAFENDPDQTEDNESDSSDDVDVEWLRKGVSMFFDISASSGYGSAQLSDTMQRILNDPGLKTLLGPKVDVVPGSSCVTALQAACYSGKGEVVQMLLEAGADVDSLGGDPGSALQAASSSGNIKAVRLLLDAKASVNAQGGTWGNALQAASSSGHSDIAQALLDAGADIEVQGAQQKTALQAGAMGGHETVLKVLLNAGANINALGGPEGTALQAAARRGHTEIVKFLLDEGANVNTQAGKQGNALQAAAAEGREATVSVLLQFGANVNAQGGEHGTALQAAAAGGHETVVEALIEAGADVNARGGKYGSALHAAIAKNHEKITERLLAAGAQKD